MVGEGPGPFRTSLVQRAARLTGSARPSVPAQKGTTMPRRRPPLSPEATAVVRALTGEAGAAGPSRRAVLGGAGALGLGALLAACGTSGTPGAGGGGGRPSTSGSAGPSPAQDRSDTDKVVNWANWTLYLDYDDKTKKYPTLEAFQKKTGIKATYAEDVDDNDTYYG